MGRKGDSGGGRGGLCCPDGPPTGSRELYTPSWLLCVPPQSQRMSVHTQLHLASASYLTGSFGFC